MATQPTITYEPLDATTKSGFLAIAEAFGRDRAWETRITQYDALYERDKDFRWWGEKWLRARRTAEFEREWERDNPGYAEILHEAGIGY
jgi:hypothetical protein